MLLKLLLLLTVVPLVELYLLLRLSPVWGGFEVTVLIILGTGILGAFLARREGLRVIGSVQRKAAAGELPADDLLDGLLVLIAAALLVTPGLLTDATGFWLLLPPTRALTRRMVKRWLKGKIAAVDINLDQGMGFRPMRDEPPPGFPPMEDED